MEENFGIEGEFDEDEDDELFGQPVRVAEGDAGPTVQVVLPGGGNRVIPWVDLQRGDADLATISDADMLRLVANHVDRDLNDFGNYQVTRPEEGRVVVMPKPAYGESATPIHTLHVMDGTGDQVIEYDPTVKTQVAPAAMVFARFAAQNFLAFAMDENGGSRRIDEFNAEEQKIVMTPYFMGG